MKIIRAMRDARARARGSHSRGVSEIPVDVRKKDEASPAGSVGLREKQISRGIRKREHTRKRDARTSDRGKVWQGRGEGGCATRTTGGYCVEEQETGLENVSRGCDKDGASEGTNKTDEIAHWCFDMGQIMFDTGDPCLVWLIARYMCVYAFFVASTPVEAAGFP